MKTKETAKQPLPPIRINPSLEQYKDKVLFSEKLAKANEMLDKVGLPKEVVTTEH